MTDAPGWYCYRPVAALAEWDGTAWTGSTHYASAAPVLAGPPKPFSFLRQSWVWWMVVGQILVIPPAVASGNTGNAGWSWLSAVGYVAFLIGTVKVMVRYLPVGRLAGLRSLTLIGIGGGVLGFGIAFGLEVVVDHSFGLTTVLWSTGPIEEGAKLLVPFALLAFGSTRFKDPLAGLYLVLVSGATTGAIEGVEWESRAHHVWLHLQLALVRPAAELPHVFVTGFAGAVIWLAAWRRGKATTLAGTAAFAVAVGLHSLHDGFITLFGVSPQPTPSSIAHTAGEAVGKGIAGGFFALGIGIAAFLLGRHGARELSPPGSVAAAPPPWRPQIKTWGAVDPVREQAPLPVGGWGAYGYAGYAGYAAPPSYADYAGYAGHAGSVPPTASGGYAVPVAPPPSAPTEPVAQAAPADLPALPALPAVPGRATMTPPPAPAAVPDLSAPPSAPPGWYPYGNDPTRTAWWSGTTWSAPVRWDGTAWRQE
ncbi:MAG TPA: PrsW family glutamic-type intramembrane protease [Acidimicrobiales bacterium]